MGKTTPLAPYVLRPGQAGDRGFVIDTWLQTYRRSQFADPIPDFCYWSRFGHVGLVEEMAETAMFTVACLPGDERFIYGWSCSDPVSGALHYVFVRQEYRGQGFGTLLMGERSRPLKITHITADFSRYLARGPVLFVNPYRSHQ